MLCVRLLQQCDYNYKLCTLARAPKKNFKQTYVSTDEMHTIHLRPINLDRRRLNPKRHAKMNSANAST